MSLPIQSGSIYGNCKMFAPDGTLLCRCNEDRAKWYLDRDLAIVTEQSPNLSIKLTFEPKGKGQSGQPFYLADKENRCVVCGTEQNLTKHHCVPRCFRKCFPGEYKFHTSHDVVPVCVPCHEKYEPFAFELKEQIARDAGFDNFHPRIAKDDPKNSIMKAANALRRYREQMPADRIAELEERLKDYYDVEEVTEDIIDQAMAMDPLKRFSDIDNFSMAIVTQIDDLDAFIRMWRQHFVDHMKPQFLHDHWSVDHITRATD